MPCAESPRNNHSAHSVAAAECQSLNGAFLIYFRLDPDLWAFHDAAPSKDHTGAGRPGSHRFLPAVEMWNALKRTHGDPAGGGMAARDRAPTPGSIGGTRSV